MSEYQALARKYRPKLFRDVVGQQPIVITLLNAIRQQKTAHAYLFCGSRGTGKTTLARLFAKALNCPHLSSEAEPCNTCSSCIEIAGGYSIDVMEIDGASHRGIEDVRQINDTIGYAPTSGRYKIYLIDEVHMLTKEAFNALLKTLEEPPPKVKFLFATTEPHKLPATILSRCQRFNLRRIPSELIQQKLLSIAGDIAVQADPEAVRLIAQLAEGGLRDAESLFEQVIAFSEREMTVEKVTEALGLLPRESLFHFDESAHQGDLKCALSLAHQFFSSGMNASYFIEELIHHFRTLLLLKLDGPCDLSEDKRKRYQSSLSFYTQPQCLDILEILCQAQQEIKSAPSEQIAIEMLLIRIARTHRKPSLETLYQRLISLEQKYASPEPAAEKEMVRPQEIPQPTPQIDKKVLANEQMPRFEPSIAEDPTPRKEEIPLRSSASIQEPIKRASKAPIKKTERPQKENHPNSKDEEEKKPDSSILPPQKVEDKQRLQTKFDTLMRFAAKELDGSLKKE